MAQTTKSRFFFHIFYSGKSYDKNITGLAVGILAMGHTRQCAYTSTRAEALVLV